MKNTVIIILLMLFCACNRESNHSLDGLWVLQEASIDGVLTDRLSDLYFSFDGDEVRTNVLGNEQTFENNTKGSVIQIQSEPQMNYRIIGMNDSLLSLRTEIQQARFDLLLQKVVE